MSDLQKINQGTAPSGTDGDTVRVGFSKVNANADVLRTQVALVSGAVITQPQALTSAHIGKRVSINLSSSGTVNLPAANTCPPDGVIALRNVGTISVALAVSGGSGDTFPLSKLHPGEAALVDTDGLNAWGVLMRGRGQGDSETVDGDLRVMGAATFDARPTFAGKVPYDNGNLSPVDTKSDQSIGGKKDFLQRPTFAGKTPWDNGNFNPASYAQLSGAAFDGAVVSTAKALNGGGAWRVSGDIGGAYVDWRTILSPALQVDCANTGSQYMGIRWTRWGGRHLAAISVYEGGSATADPSIAMLVDADAGPGFYFRSGGRGTYAGSWTQWSDYRLKCDFTSLDADDVLRRVMLLRPMEYSRREKALAGNRFPGFIAHEIQEQFPLVVRGTKDGTRVEAGEEIPDYQSVDYISLTAYLTAALQAAVIRIEALEKSVFK
ncbi:tail fiber domain-containing protein [Burkholderia ubonensis]|nr:tail fiber domain-containing protein [Burkholderia ubonensis]